MQSQTTGERVKALLQARNLTQASAAELIGISDSTLGRIINDRSNGISSTTLQLMCKALHCTAADILGDQPDPPPAPDDPPASDPGSGAQSPEPSLEK